MTFIEELRQVFRSQRRGGNCWASLLAWMASLAGGVVIAAIWHPVFSHYWVRQSAPGVAELERLRVLPSSAELDVVVSQPAVGPKVPGPLDARRLATPWLSSPGSAARVLTGDDLIRADPLASLAFSSLSHVDVLVAAYRATMESHYLYAARDHLLAYARYEREAWRQRGFLWNDHAVAARVGVIVRFWAVYRQHPAYDATAAAQVLQHLRRCAVLLARPTHFTAWSNHGVMQNLALLQAAAAFPGLLESAALQRLAYDRLALQWRYYISDEGVILEHSAGYHAEGLLLLRSALELLQAAGLNPPASWSAQLEHAQAFLTLMTRPDGSLPAYGDTRLPATETSAVAPTDEATLDGRTTRSDLSLWPVSGYGLIRVLAPGERVVAHAVTTWSYFPGQAHKQADELGWMLWAAGRSWITPSGYAPYGTAYRPPVEGWLGSNAPHRLGESPSAQRQSILLASGRSGPVAMLDLQREHGQGRGWRRQIVAIGAHAWLVIDEPLGRPDVEMEVLWTFAPDLTMLAGGAGILDLRDKNGLNLSMQVLPESPVVAARRQPLHGSLQPFGGWVMTEAGVQPAPALHVSGRSGWIVTLFQLGGGVEPSRASFQSAEHWHVESKEWQVRRSGPTLVVRWGKDEHAMSLATPTDVASRQQAISAALRETVARFPKYVDLDFYRQRVAIVLCLVWMVQLIGRVGLRSRLGRATLARLDGLTLCSWIALAWWLARHYFS